MKKKLFLSLIFSSMILNMSVAAVTEIAVDESRCKVAVTFDAMKELTKAVTGDKADIYLIIPNGVEPHDFEPKAKDLEFVSKADVLVYNGLGMEFWLDEALAAVKNTKLIKVEASKGIKPIKCTMEHEHKHDHTEKCCNGKHGSLDPHAWLSLNSAKIMVTNIAAAMGKADPANAAIYKANAKDYIAELNTLIKEYKGKFKRIKTKKFVTDHAAFGYLCRDLGLSQNAIMGVFAEGEPNAKQLAKLIDYCKQNNIKVIFSEELADPQLSQTLAKEVNAKIEKIYTLESSEGGLTYLERMKKNLETIYDNLNN